MDISETELCSRRGTSENILKIVQEARRHRGGGGGGHPFNINTYESSHSWLNWPIHKNYARSRHEYDLNGKRRGRWGSVTASRINSVSGVHDGNWLRVFMYWPNVEQSTAARH